MKHVYGNLPLNKSTYSLGLSAIGMLGVIAVICGQYVLLRF